MKKLYNLTVATLKMKFKHFKGRVTHHSIEEEIEEYKINICRAPNSFQLSGYGLLS